MDGFSIGSAWTLGYRFIAPRVLMHSLILIVMGIALPFALQYAILGGPFEAMSPARLGPVPGLIDAPQYLAAAALGYLLQTGSYFAALHFGFGGERSAGGAILFGLVAGLIAVLVIAAGHLLGMFGSRPFLTEDTLPIAVAIFLLPLVLVYSLFFISQAIMVAGAAILLLGFAMAYGAIQGQMGLAATIAGGSGSVAVLLLVLAGLLFWLAARFSCVTPLMADRKSLNLFTAIRDSWRLTWEEQWGITRYLALIGFVVALVIILGSLAVGAGVDGYLQGGEATDNLLAIAVRLVLAIPFAFLCVAIPAGIYRQLVGVETPAEIFA
jgi:hypothetical protein